MNPNLYLRLLALIAIGSFYSCSDNIVPVDVTNTQDTQQVVIHDQKPTSIFDLEIGLKNGILHFKSQDDLSYAIDILGGMEDEAILSWYKTLNFDSYFQKYIELTAALSDSEEHIAMKSLSEIDDNQFNILNEGGVAIPPAFQIKSRVLSVNLEVYVGEYYHKYNRNHHFIAKVNAMNSAAILKGDIKHDPSNGLFVTQTNSQSVNLSSNISSSEALSLEKTATNEFNCVSPVSYFNQFNEFKTDITQRDEQRIGCSQKRCRERTFGTYLAETEVTGQDTGGNLILTSRVVYSYVNLKRDRWKWNPRFTDTRIDVSLSISDICNPPPFLGQEAYEIVISRNDNNSSSGSLLIYSNSSTSNNCELHQGFGNIGTVVSGNELEGNVSHTWTNFGNQSDPIQVIIGCRRQ